jgi:hypothetical protein
MEDHWRSLVDERTKDLMYFDDNKDNNSILPTLCCLSDEQACLVEGKKQSMQIVSMIPQMG